VRKVSFRMASLLVWLFNSTTPEVCEFSSFVKARRGKLAERVFSVLDRTTSAKARTREEPTELLP